MKIKTKKAKKIIKQEEVSVTTNEINVQRIAFIPDKNILRVVSKEYGKIDVELAEDDQLVIDIIAKVKEILEK